MLITGKRQLLILPPVVIVPGSTVASATLHTFNHTRDKHCWASQQWHPASNNDKIMTCRTNTGYPISSAVEAKPRPLSVLATFLTLERAMCPKMTAGIVASMPRTEETIARARLQTASLLTLLLEPLLLDDDICFFICNYCINCANV